MKVFELDEYIRNWYSNVDNVDKKAFWVFFICMNVVFLYNSVFCLFGNEDIIVMFEKQSPFYAYFVGRYGVSLLEYFIANKTIIPMFINIILFSFLSLTTVLTLNWFKLKKNLFNFLLAGLFILLPPTIYPILWYRSVCFGILMTMFFTIISFFICQKIIDTENKKKKLLYFSISLFLLTSFVFGSYHPVIGCVFGLLFSRIFIDYIDSSFLGIKNIFFKYRYVFLSLFASIGIDYLVFLILKINGLIDNVYYPCANLIKFSEFYNYIFPFLTRTLHSFFVDTFPYVGLFYKVFLWLILLVSVISVFVLQKKKNRHIKGQLFSIFYIVFFYLLLFYIFNILYFLSPVFYTKQHLFRLEYWTTTYFIFVCIVFALKYSNIFLKNISFCLVTVLIFLGIQINMHVQKDQMIGQQIELSRVMTLKNLILRNKNYEHSDSIKYLFVQIGNIKSSGVIETYNSNEFNNAYVPEMISTFQTDRAFHLPLVVVPPKITNINPYASTVVNIFSQLEKYLDNNLIDWLLNEARPYPSPNCVFIDKGKIYVVMDQKFLSAIKARLLDQQKI